MKNGMVFREGLQYSRPNLGRTVLHLLLCFVRNVFPVHSSTIKIDTTSPDSRSTQGFCQVIENISISVRS